MPTTPTPTPTAIDPGEHRRLVAAIARDHLGCGLDLDDLIAAGDVGLVDAARRFDPGRGVSFRTFARPRVRGAILNAIADEGRTVRIPRRYHGPVGEARTGACADAARRARAAGTVGDSTLGDVPLAERVADRRPPEHWPAGALVADLPADQAAVITRRYGLDGAPAATPDEIATALGLTAGRVAELHELAIRTLRRRLDDEDLPPTPNLDEEPPMSATRLNGYADRAPAHGRPPGKGACPSCGVKYKKLKRCYNRACELCSIRRPGERPGERVLK